MLLFIKFRLERDLDGIIRILFFLYFLKGYFGVEFYFFFI